jgi:Tannase and feruloyl esterase
MNRYRVWVVGAMASATAGLLLIGCADISTAPGPVSLGPDPAVACGALTAPIPASVIGLPSGAATIDAATWMAATPLAVAEHGPTPAGRVTPATSAFCRVLGRIAAVNPSSPPILFQVNLPARWNGRSLQYGGGGFNGVLITALGLPPAQRFDTPTPLEQGFVTVGTDSGHQSKATDIPQAFALDDEALANFAHTSYKKVRDVSVALTQRAYGRKPDRLYFMGSSEGGREALTMAQRYPADFDGIFARVPVISWTGLQHAGLRDGLATRGDAWLSPAHTKLVHDAVLAACDAVDGLADGLVADPVGCRQRFDVTKLRCAGTASDACLTDPQIKAVQTLHAPLRLGVDLANGVREYPGRGPSGEALPSFGPTGGWQTWWLGGTAPALPPVPANGIAWFYGAGAIQYFYARDPKADLLSYTPEANAARVREVSALMDSTEPDLSAFQARGGKLVMLEYLSDYAQSPYAGIGYFESVQAKLGREATERFARLYTTPGVDHVGSGAPANVDMLAVLTDWVERGRAPGTLEIVEQEVKVPFPVKRALPLCQWPLWPRFKAGAATQAASFECAR